MIQEMLFNNIYFGLLLCVGGYLAGMGLRRRFGLAIFNPLLVSIVIAIVFLIVFRVPYEFFNRGAQGLSMMITPCTVCLAVPLYRQVEMLKKNFKAVMIGCVSGVLASLTSILLLSLIFRFPENVYVSLLPKSITTAIGMGISQELGGIPNLTVGAIVMTGLFGNMVAAAVVKVFGIKEPLAAGLAIGSSSHALGTAKALEMGELQGAMSSLAISVCGLMTVLGASLFAALY